MNKEDYKKIAEIIKSTKIFQMTKEELCTNLADYFENQDIKMKSLNILACGKERIFDKKQFLKDCGVE